MPTKKTGNPPGRPKKVDADSKGKKFDAMTTHHRKANFDFACHAIFDSGARYFVGSLSDCSHEAVGSKFGGGTFELVKREVATKKLIGEPIVLAVHPNLYKVKFTDPFAPTAPVSGPFSHLGPQGAPGAGAPSVGGGNEEVMRAIEGLRGELDDRLAEADDKREEEARAREREEQDRKLKDLEAKLEAALAAPKTSATDELVKLLTVARELNPPKPAFDVQTVVAAIPTVLSGLLSFGKQVVASQPSNPVDAGDAALQLLMRSFAPVLERYASGNLNLPAPQGANNGQPGAPVAPAQLTEEQMLQMATSQLVQRLNMALHGQQEDSPEAVAQWVWSQNGPGWNFVHAFIVRAEPTELVQVVLLNAPGLVKSPEDHDGLLAIATALKAASPANAAPLPKQ